MSRKSKPQILVALVTLAITPGTAMGQTPVISAVVDAASYTSTRGAAGSIATIFGTNLAATTATAQTTPLPRELGGTKVTWNGVAASIFYVSPSQINFQVPARDNHTPGVLILPGVLVSSAAGNSVPYDPNEATPNTWPIAGIFSLDGGGCGPAALLNVAPDGSTSLNSASNSASRGDWITMYGTGLGSWLDGNPAPTTPPIGGLTADVEFDFAVFPQAYPPESWSGLAPGLVGVNQFNARIPPTVREGCTVPVQINYYGTTQALSQPLTLAIRNGGGHCVDPPLAGYGEITLQKTVSESPAPINSKQQYYSSETDTLTVSLQASPGKQAPAAPIYSDGCNSAGNVCNGPRAPNSYTYFGPACPVPGYRSLEAGDVTLQGPSLGTLPVPSLPYQQGQLGGLYAYQATLSNGAIQAGTYRITANGGGDVGAFQTSTQVGSDIQIQTPLVGTNVWSGCKPLTIDWTGGDANSWVTVRFVQQAPAAYGGYQWVNFAYRTRASRGSMTIPKVVPGSGCSTNDGQPFTISIEVEPDPSQITTFSAPGLSLGGRVRWSYVHTFEATIYLP